MKNRNKQCSRSKQAGFTLVELSIVLVIIGLIVSGILVGQDMIRAAEIRSTVSQMDGFNTAVNTFRDKYRNIPGDTTGGATGDALKFGFVARTGAIGRGDGNRLLQADVVATASPFTERYLGFETGLFWADLSKAGLIGNNFTTAADALATVSPSAVATWLPEVKIGQGHYYAIASQNGRNYYNIAQVLGITAGAYNLGAAMTPQTAFNIDQKMDDANPITGIVNATYDVGTTAQLGITYTAAVTAAGINVQVPITATTGAGACVFSTAAGNIANAAYNTVTDTDANRPACQLRVKASF